MDCDPDSNLVLRPGTSVNAPISIIITETVKSRFGSDHDQANFNLCNRAMVGPRPSRVLQCLLLSIAFDSVLAVL